MEHLPTVLATLAVCLAAVALIGLGWRNRLRRQAGVAAPAPAPAGLGEPAAAAEGQYVSTTTAGDWLDRIAVHSLGVRCGALAEVHPDGVLFRRAGATDLYIPRADLVGVRRSSGQAGKFVERDGLLVLTWALGDRHVDTAFRPRAAADLRRLEAALADPAPGTPGTESSPQNPAPERDTP